MCLTSIVLVQHTAQQHDLSVELAKTKAQLTKATQSETTLFTTLTKLQATHEALKVFARYYSNEFLLMSILGKKKGRKE